MFQLEASDIQKVDLAIGTTRMIKRSGVVAISVAHVDLPVNDNRWSVFSFSSTESSRFLPRKSDFMIAFPTGTMEFALSHIIHLQIIRLSAEESIPSQPCFFRRTIPSFMLLKKERGGVSHAFMSIVVFLTTTYNSNEGKRGCQELRIRT
jgi:hypothetical protein